MTRTFLFNTGVKRSNGPNYSGDKSAPIPLMPGQQWSPNGVKVIPFQCNDVPEGASLMFLCDGDQLIQNEPNVIVRELLPGSAMLSTHAYFKLP